jgi:glycolate oxidase FAD binding subunit
VLLVRFDGSARAVITQTAQALKALRDEGFRCSTQDDDGSIWQTLAAASFETKLDLSWRVLVRPSDLVSFAADVAMSERDESSGVGLQWHAGLADGRLRAMARTPVYHQQAVRELERLRERAEDFGGSLIVERAPVEIKREFDSWGSFGSAEELMKRVKQQLDPENLLSPGRFF